MQLDSDAHLVGHSIGHAACAFGPLQAARTRLRRSTAAFPSAIYHQGVETTGMSLPDDATADQDPSGPVSPKDGRLQFGSDVRSMLKISRRHDPCGDGRLARPGPQDLLYLKRSEAKILRAPCWHGGRGPSPASTIREAVATSSYPASFSSRASTAPGSRSERPSPPLIACPHSPATG